MNNTLISNRFLFQQASTSCFQVGSMDQQQEPVSPCIVWTWKCVHGEASAYDNGTLIIMSNDLDWEPTVPGGFTFCNCNAIVYSVKNEATITNT